MSDWDNGDLAWIQVTEETEPVVGIRGETEDKGPGWILYGHRFFQGHEVERVVGRVHVVPLGSGSSVPEAARAAARDALVPHSFNARYTVNTDGSWTWKCSCGHEYAHGVEIATQEVEHRAAAVVEAASPALVAAAVAEERATTGRRIEAALAFRDSERGVSCAGYSVDDDGCFVAGLAARVRAALASPGEYE